MAEIPKEKIINKVQQPIELRIQLLFIIFLCFFKLSNHGKFGFLKIVCMRCSGHSDG